MGADRQSARAEDRLTTWGTFDKIPFSGFRQPNTALDHSRHFDGLAMISGIPPEADIVTAGRHVSKVPILLQKSFWGGERKFLEPLMRCAPGDVRDHIVSSKIEHGPS